MESKTVLYVVLAVFLGYFLISDIPSRLASLPEETPRSVPEEVLGLDLEEPLAKGLEPPLLGPASRGVWDGAVALGIWIVDLMVALGVYFVVKRRIS